MLEASEAKELIAEAVEQEEKKEDAGRAAEAKAERTFRNRVALLVGVFAVLLAVIHMAAAGAARESLLTAVQASDTYNYMQAKNVREAIFKTAAAGGGGASAADRAAFAAEAKRLRAPDKSGHGIDQLREKGEELERENAVARRASEVYELGETALQVAIVLLSIAIVARSGAIVIGAVAFAALGVGLALVTRAGMALPWVG